MASRNNSPYIIRFTLSNDKGAEYTINTSTVSYATDWRTAATPLWTALQAYEADYDLRQIHMLAFIKDEGFATPTTGWGQPLYPTEKTHKVRTSLTYGADVLTSTRDTFYSSVLTDLTALEALATPVV